MTLDIFDDVLSALEDGAFEERPVDARTFVESPEYLNHPPLSDLQYLAVECMSQIYRPRELEALYGLEAGAEFHRKYTKTEIILQLGKGCHAPYTPVFDGESGKWVPLSDMKEGAVGTMDGSRYATEPFYEGTGEMVRVRTSLGFEEDVFVNHKYFSMKKNKFYKRFERPTHGEFIDIQDLEVGDRVAVGLNMEPSNPIDIPEEHAELIGYWLGDGMLPADHNPSMNMDFSITEHESIARYLELCEFIGEVPTRKSHRTKKMVSFTHGHNSNAVKLAKLYGLWGLRSRTKFIPDAVWKSSNRVLAKTIAKLWQTDGCVYAKNGMTAEYVSVSEQLAHDVQRGLLRLGVPSTIRSRIPKSNFPNPSRAYYVSVSSQECFNAFHDKISLLDHKRTSSINKKGRTYLRIDENIYWDRIVSIEPIGIGDYWTRTVPSNEHYVGNGLVSKNSGKDLTATIAVAYIVYKLLCLTDPARYYGKPTGDAIDIINIAINAQQAKNVFFKGFLNKITRSRWFKGKYEAKSDSVEFAKGITVYSGHSERESHEGLNIFCAVLDEISGFSMESSTGHVNAKTGDAIYRAFRGTVDSRFSDYGKVILLSFPRRKDCFISQKYESAIAEKVVQVRSHTFKLHEDLPDGVEGNEFTIEWEEDHIVQYTLPGVFALKRPTWEFNPTRQIEDFKNAFYTDELDALQRFACQAPDSANDDYFKDHALLEELFSQTPAIVEGESYQPWFKPDPEQSYFIHVDLAQKHDRCAIAMAHVVAWNTSALIPNSEWAAPVVQIDMVYWWTPSKDKSVDFNDVRNTILGLRTRGFNIKTVTFDRWGSHDMMQELQSLGVNTEILSVAKKHYDDFKVALYDSRVSGPNIELLIEEFKQLQVVKGDKIDHRRKSSKDLADAVVGAVFNASTLTPRGTTEITEIKTLATRRHPEPETNGVIRAPKGSQMPNELRDYLHNIRMV